MAIFGSRYFNDLLKAVGLAYRDGNKEIEAQEPASKEEMGCDFQSLPARRRADCDRKAREGDTLICPWHGYRYDITDGHLHLDPNASLEMYPVEIKGSEIHIQVPIITWDDDAEQDLQEPTENVNKFKMSELASGRIKLLSVNEEQVAVFAVGEKVYAVQSRASERKTAGW